MVPWVRTFEQDWHPGLDVILPRGRSSTWIASIERSRLVLSLSFTSSSLSSFTCKQLSVRTLPLSLSVPISRLNSASVCERTRVQHRIVCHKRGRKELTSRAV